MPTPRSRTQRIAQSVATTSALAVLVLTAGCSSGPDPAGDIDTTSGEGGDTRATASKESEESASPVEPPPEFGGVGHKLPAGKDLENDADLYQTVALTDCASSSAGVEATGTVENNTVDEVDYTIVVIFTDPQARMVDSATARISVEPGAEATWRAGRTFEAPKGVECVVRAVRGA
ncbi:hypothetical protein GCM10023339_07570 [Alloalcanivorax gelatiniphagus]